MGRGFYVFTETSNFTFLREDDEEAASQAGEAAAADVSVAGLTIAVAGAWDAQPLCMRSYLLILCVLYV